jgi:hypothetical protein
MVSGSYTTAVNGVISRSLKLTGTYSFSRDGKTGSISFRDDTGRTDRMFFVPVDDGKELFLISTKPKPISNQEIGNTISSQMIRQ